MGAAFWCPDAPYIWTPCPFCDGFCSCMRPRRLCTETASPSFSVTYTTTSILLEAVGIEYDDVGTIPVDEVAVVLARFETAVCPNRFWPYFRELLEYALENQFVVGWG